MVFAVEIYVVVAAFVNFMDWNVAKIFNYLFIYFLLLGGLLRFSFTLNWISTKLQLYALYTQKRKLSIN